ncbi:DNA/RNA nuclease SfsA [Gammaproteobacteria bacterium AS21]
MKYEQKLISAVLVKRYKRFLADVVLEDGSMLTVHCANTGAMTGCAIAGSKVWLSESANLKRKYAFSWELVELEHNAGFIAVNTARANQVVESALFDKKIIELAQYDSFKREVKYGDSSRVDFFLSGAGLPDVYLEVKSVTLHREGDLGAFPDAVTLRGQKHLRELLAVKKSGNRAVLLFCVLHSEIKEVSVADDIDSVYGQLLRDVIKQGVEVYCYSVDMSVTQLELGNKLVLKV